MAISKLNAEQFANMAVNAAGVIFEYAGKDLSLIHISEPTRP